MAKKSKVEFDLTGLKVIQTSLKKLTDHKYSVQVGIFGEKDMRKKSKDKGVTNAEIGMIHEMGSVERNIPRRSFLWDTFSNHGKELMEVLKKDAATLMKTGKIEEYLKRVGLASVNLVIEAFNTGGWGAWPPNAYSTLLRKFKGTLSRRRQMAAEVQFEGAGHDKLLWDTGQLMQSISSRTVKL